MAATASPGNSSWVRSPTTSRASYYSHRPRPLPNPPNRGGIPNPPAYNTPHPLPVPVPGPPPPLEVSTSHANVFFDRFIGGFRRYVMPKRNTLPDVDVEAHTGRTPVPFPTIPYPENQHYDYSGDRDRTVTMRSEGAGDRRTYTTDDASVPEPSNMLLSVPGPASMHPSRSPSMLMSPQSLAPHPSLAPSLHHSIVPSMHHSQAGNALSVQVGQPSRSRTSSTGRFERHSSRAPSEDPVSGETDGEGEGDVATAVGHSDGAALSIQPPASASYPQNNFSQGNGTHADEIKLPDSHAQPRSPYASTFALILAAIKHISKLPLTAPIITEEWTAPAARSERLSQMDSWYTRSTRDGLYPGAPPGANVYPPALPITTTISLSPGILPPRNAFFPDNRPWQPGAGMPYYYPQPREPYEPSSALPQSMMQPDYSTAPPMRTSNITLLNAPPAIRHLHPPSIHATPSTYHSATPSVHTLAIPYARAH